MPNSGAYANVKVLWDPQHIYVLADMSDELLSNKSANNYEHDSFEIFLDENNAKSESYQADDYQFRINFKNARSYGGYAKAPLIRSETIITDTGYLIEATINLQTVEAAVGSILGVDFQVNDVDEGNGKRGSIAKWNDSTNESWRNTSGWGTLKLVE
jgi:endo-1,4-beta-xylanase